ncbi:MAG: TIGR03087 family PEP-CTERM/XrtA system glycosyltransferase [Gammaproteobacteria bacterium]|nr:MAG: TIGR03087 family PEP-CTERM/XrtA system glycosyltransferase [Gammaproteobacteria bacterium]
MRLLYLVHRIPYPPNKGDKIRSYHILRHLAARHQVFLGGFYDDPRDREHVEALRAYATEVRFHFLARHRLWRCGPRALLRGTPVTLEAFRDARLQAWVEGLLARRAVDAVYVFSSAMGQYLPRVPPSGVRVLVDLVDVDSEKWREYARNRHGHLLLRWIYHREARRLRAFELALAARADATLLVSEEEAALFRTLAADAGTVDLARIHSLRNGVDLAYFDPGRAHARPFADGGAHLVFTGAMDYWANIDGVEWFVRSVLPAVRARRGDVRLHVVGANPDPRVRALAGEAVDVTGYVADVRPYLAHADVVVCPLRIARGIQNKVLEAMAMARPLVATPEALTGIGCAPLDRLGTRDPRTMAARILALLDDRTQAQSLGRAGRAHVEAHFGWEAALQRLDGFLERPAQLPFGGNSG